MINIEALRQINYIIEHDATSSTYKYVLLKSTINACQKFDHLIKVDTKTAHIPLGLLVEQWILDYMPFVLQDTIQQHSGSVFDKPITQTYYDIFESLHLDTFATWEYSYTQFVKAYENSNMPAPLSSLFVKLSKQIAKKIVSMPMRYMGKSEYEIFIPEQKNFGHIKLSKEDKYSTGFLINNFGYFSISKQHYDVFRYLGQTLYGTSTIMNKWKAKTISLNGELSEGRGIIDKLSSDELENRDTSTIRNYLGRENECVWSGKPLRTNNYDVDHVLPYSVWFNNDLWNMLPTDRVVNQKQKKAKIPTPELIIKRSDIIKSYWEQYLQQWPVQFKGQIEVALTGPNVREEQLTDYAIEALCGKAHYLIHDRGHISFSL